MKLKSIIGTTLLIFITSAMLALPPSGVGGDPDKEDPDDKEVPIDGGVGILLLAGAALGAKKMFNKKK